MSQPPRKQATYEDILELPEHKVGEIVDGELYASPRPAVAHSLASSALGVELAGPFQFGRGGPGGWWILDEPELHLGPDVLVPDLAGWRRERVPRLPQAAYLTLAPDWVCEVLSPSTARLDLVKKSPKYAAAGSSHLWRVDPALRMLEVLRRDGQRWTLLGTFTDRDRVRAEPFGEVEIELERMWA